MKKLREIIVVEGKDDTVAIKRAVNADTIETNGSAINEKTLLMIRKAQETRGVIVFTDPDYPGEKIRKTIQQHVPGCRHAFLPKQEAIAKNSKGLGVEHASVESIRRALADAHEEQGEYELLIPYEELLLAGLIGGEHARARREKLGDMLHIGYTNAKQLQKRLAMFKVTEEAFRNAMIQIFQEEDRK
ncbi:ribonuclease M5 [Bacillus sp. HMF5848]|uniref:ribonuclease M5 n=1 Tax=Bacillus sp. HMF5848 TaxID=2495421 RepID=UPI000F788ED2|nr:ribonuclease M5 [Bacillus sp. HMF5848]RSK25474.1 ribonuclease M5 [Bacillus sp. HMF5848]